MKFIIATAAAALLSTSAFAADAVFASDPVPAAVAQAPAYAWSGAYVGVNAGYGFGKAKGYYTDFEDPEYSENSSLNGKGFLGGVQAGYNWQSGSVVYGLETDLQYADIKAKEEYEGAAKIDWFGTTRARVGYAPADRVLAYATGGVAYGKLRLDTWLFDISKTQIGWTVGAGVEYALDNNWSLKTEYLYTDLGKWTVTESDWDRNEMSFNFHTIRAGLNYKF